jgi:porphobilinogen synthase
MNVLIRPRRLRKNQILRDLSEETKVTAHDLIYPVFVKDAINRKEEIKSMPGIYRHSIESLLYEIEESLELGIRAFALFSVIDPSFKNSQANESYNPEGLTQRTIRNIKTRFPEALLITDIALDPYTDHGHDGLLGDDGEIINDATVEILCKMALAQAEAGADIVAPSDMMDGRVKAIREALDRHDFSNTAIMAYTAKYASCLYGPFRDALGSLGSGELSSSRARTATALLEQNVMKIPQDKKTYQMNPANATEALRELDLDIGEGADIIMVKPASWYLDIISKFKSRATVPVAAYQVSGEYSMIHAAAQTGYINLNQAIHESLISIKRAGADIILSYFAKDFLRTCLESSRTRLAKSEAA